MERKKVEQYFMRIGLPLPEDQTADGELLARIYRAQVTHIPYENIDYLNLTKEDMTPDSLFRQIVEEGRGGVCYDLNALLGIVLCELGFEAYPVMADHYRTHMEGTIYRHSGLIVRDCRGGTWLSDVGDSFSGALCPLQLVDGAEQHPGNEAYLLKKREDGSWMLYVSLKGEWVANYAFREEPASLEELTYYKLAAMDPGIQFTQEELFHLRTDTGYRLLRGRTFCEKDGAQKTARVVDDGELPRLYSLFGLRFPYASYARLP